MYDLRVTVEEVRGFCDLPMRPGDHFEVRGGRITVPAGGHICLWALAALLPMFPVKQRDILDRNDWIPATRHMCCPDPNGMVIYRIDRIGEGADAPDTRSDAHKAETKPPAETKSPAETASGGDTGSIAAATPTASASTSARPPARLLVNEKLCSGCLSCELACSAAQSGGAAFRPAVSRIHVVKLEREGIDRPLACRQCGQARCVAACPEGALSRHPRTKAVLLNAAACTMCHACAEACPFEVVRFHPETGLPMICDLCGGEPQCVKRCATGALKFGLAGDQLPLAPAERYLAPPEMPPAVYDDAVPNDPGETGGEQA